MARDEARRAMLAPCKEGSESPRGARRTISRLRRYFVADSSTKNDAMGSHFHTNESVFKD